MNILLVEDNLVIVDALKLVFQDRSDFFEAVTNLSETRL